MFFRGKKSCSSDPTDCLRCLPCPALPVRVDCFALLALIILPSWPCRYICFIHLLVPSLSLFSSLSFEYIFSTFVVFSSLSVSTYLSIYIWWRTEKAPRHYIYIYCHKLHLHFACTLHSYSFWVKSPLLLSIYLFYLDYYSTLMDTYLLSRNLTNILLLSIIPYLFSHITTSLA